MVCLKSSLILLCLIFGTFSQEEPCQPRLIKLQIGDYYSNQNMTNSTGKVSF
jgi:hypothetical protein